MVISVAVAVVFLYAIRRGKRLVAQIGSMHFELSNNSGSSVKDQIEGISVRTAQMTQLLLSLDEAFWSLEARVSNLEDQRRGAA